MKTIWRGMSRRAEQTPVIESAAVGSESEGMAAKRLIACVVGARASCMRMSQLWLLRILAFRQYMCAPPSYLGEDVVVSCDGYYNRHNY